LNAFFLGDNLPQKHVHKLKKMAAEQKLEPGSWLDPSVKKSALEARKLEYE